MMSSPCPSAEILASAATEALTEDLEQHLANCAVCRRRLDEIRRELALLADARASFAGCVNAQTRARLVEICTRVLEEERSRFKRPE